MTEPNYTEEQLTLAKRLEMLTQQLEDFEAQSAEFSKMEQKFEADKKHLQEEYKERMAALNQANSDMLYSFSKIKKEMKALKEEKDSAQRQFEQELALKKAQEEMLTLEARWLNLTKNAKWQEYAKQHQFDGANWITFTRQGILADTVGLGKTLTTIAAVDLIKAATKDGDTWTERMRTQQYHPQSNLCEMNGCRATGGYSDAESTVLEMYGKCEIIHTAPPAGRKILYICPAALVKNVQAEFRKWTGLRDDTKNEPSQVKDKVSELLDVDSFLSDLGLSTETADAPVVAEHSTETPVEDADSIVSVRMTVNMSKQSKTQRRYLINEVLKDLDEFVVIINYESWRKDAALISDLASLNFDTIMIDEAHNAKDRSSITYRGIAALINGTNLRTSNTQDLVQIAEQPIRYVIPMTGTPILNRPQEFYTLLTLVDPKSFPNTTYGEAAFLRDYCIKDYDTNKWTFRAGGVDSLLKRFGNKILRRDRKMAGIITPPQAIQYHDLDIKEDEYADQCAARKQMRETAMIVLDADRGEAIVAGAMIAVFTRLRQVETWPDGIELKDKDGVVLLKVNIKQSQKLDYVIKYDSKDQEWDGLLPEVCPAERTVIFSQFNGPLEEIEKRAKAYGLRVGFIRGGQSEAERNEIRIDADRYHDGIKDYQTKYDLLLINYKAGGVGLNLNDFTQTIILDEEWNPGKRDQAYGRTDRMGQTEETTVHVIRMNNTIDSWMAGLIDFKESMTSGFENAISAQSLREGIERGEI